MTPQQQAQEFCDHLGMAAKDNNYLVELATRAILAGNANGYERGHAAGIQAERERIWAEIDNNWQGTSWRMLVKRIIFGEQP